MVVIIVLTLVFWTWMNMGDDEVGCLGLIIMLIFAMALFSMGGGMF